MRFLLAALFLMDFSHSQATAAEAAPAEVPLQYLDGATGHRVTRLSTEPGSKSLYFHQNAYSPDGRKLIITTPMGLSTIDLQTRETRQIVAGRVEVIVTGRRSGRVFYIKNRVLCATDLESGATKEIAPLPPGASVATLNADETLLAGAITERRANPAPAVPNPALTFAEQKEEMLNNRLEARVPMQLFTLDVQTGALQTFYRATDWLNHIQFSPTDPHLLMFCHEGPWHKVDRIWTIRTDGTALTKIHTRTMNMEIAGHEFFSSDGKTIWYDLQTPRGQDFWVAGYNLETKQRTHYHLERNEWSVHFNVSPDGKLFAGDGGDSEMVAHAPDGKWIYLFRPQTIPDVAGIKAPNSAELIQPGFFVAEKLVDLRKHDYRLEPNLTFSPDGKRLIFSSNMFGPTHVFAVETAR
jgi:oligogalacturonide lyase